MNNGCPECDKLARKAIRRKIAPVLCLKCQIEQADADITRDMRILEELKRKKEKDNAINL